jgi:hypothetical protein
MRNLIAIIFFTSLSLHAFSQDRIIFTLDTNIKAEVDNYFGDEVFHLFIGIKDGSLFKVNKEITIKDGEEKVKSNAIYYIGLLSTGITDISFQIKYNSEKNAFHFDISIYDYLRAKEELDAKFEKNLFSPNKLSFNKDGERIIFSISSDKIIIRDEFGDDLGYFTGKLMEISSVNFEYQLE